MTETLQPPREKRTRIEATEAEQGRQYAERLIEVTEDKHFREPLQLGEMNSDRLNFVANDLIEPYQKANWAECRSESCEIPLDGMLVKLRGEAVWCFASTIRAFVTKHQGELPGDTVAEFADA